MPQRSHPVPPHPEEGEPPAQEPVEKPSEAPGGNERPEEPVVKPTVEQAETVAVPAEDPAEAPVNKPAEAHAENEQPEADATTVIPSQPVVMPPLPSGPPAPGNGKKKGLLKASKDRNDVAAAGATKPGSKKSKRIWLAVAAVVLIAGGAVGGHFLTDPTRSEEYQALADESAQRQAKLEESQADYSDLKGDYNKLSSGIYNREKTVGEREEAVTKAEADVKARESAVTSAEQQKAANTIVDGTWTVGTKVSPGTYTTTADVGSRCYWGIYRSGSNGDDIIQNDIPGGGRPTVTLAEGQDFKSSNCGKWEKQ